MLEKMKYVNHIKETIDFGTFPFFVNENDLRNFAWNITSKNDRIATFRKGVITKKLPVIVKCRSEDEGFEARNRLFEVTEKDVLAMKHGKICIGDYYLKCYITGSKKTEYLINKGYMLVELTVQTDFPEWVMETIHTFRKEATQMSGYLDYAFDYAYDYANVQNNGTMNNRNFVPSNFIMVIYGAIINPTIYIGGHKYNVDVEINDGEYLTIDSVEKTIVLTRKNGETVNCFDLRNREEYVFEKIPTGSNELYSPNESIWFSIALLDERSEPKWI